MMNTAGVISSDAGLNASEEANFIAKIRFDIVEVTVDFQEIRRMGSFKRLMI